MIINLWVDKEKEIKTIFLDLDDVCNDFMAYALKWLGELKSPNLLENIENIENIDEKEIWNHDFWRSIPESKEFRPLLQWKLQY